MFNVLHFQESFSTCEYEIESMICLKMFKVEILFCLWSALMMITKSASNNKHRIQQTTTRPIQLLNQQNWICSFAINNCGIVNEPKLLNFILLPERTLCHEKGIYFLNIVSNSKLAGARLITPYFYQYQQQNSSTINRCLTMKYMYFGNSFIQLIIWQQDRFNKKISLKNIFPNGYWRFIVINLTDLLPEMASRFFIEIRTGFDNGFLALSELAITTDCLH